MKTIKINFVDFWVGFDKNDNFITYTLAEKYNILIDDKTPDYIFVSCFGVDYQEYNDSNAIKIYFSGENICPDFNLFDYAIAFDHIQFDQRYLRLPLYAVYSSFEKLSNPKIIDAEELLNRKFCSFVYSNTLLAHPARAEFFNELSKYKIVDAGGAMFNNVGGRVPDKLEFIKKYKFNIAFENSVIDGYTTEKIMEPMCVNSLPIYFGNPKIALDFNPKSFVNANDFSSWDELVKYIAYLDQNDTQYIDILKQPWILDTKYLNWKIMLLEFLSNIIDKPLHEAKILQQYGFTHNYLAKFKTKPINELSFIGRIKSKFIK